MLTYEINDLHFHRCLLLGDIASIYLPKIKKNCIFLFAKEARDTKTFKD